MYHRARTTKTSATSLKSPSKSKTKSTPIKKTTGTAIQKKTPGKKSPVKIPEMRPKRLSSSTASALLQYCTTVPTPSKKPKSTSTASNKIKSSKDDTDIQPESNIPTRTRREASSRASAMIMQQNEIERSRYSYSKRPPTSTTIRRQHTKSSVTTDKNPVLSEQPFQFNVPSIPPLPVPTRSITNVSNQTEYPQSSNTLASKSTHSTASKLMSNNSKYPSLTEDALAEHDRLYDTIPANQTTKQDNLIKWTQELALCGRLSPPYSKDEIPPENTKEPSPSATSTPTFLFPTTSYPLDLRSFYPILPCWQYPTWPFQPSVTQSEVKTKNSKQNSDALTVHLHTHHHHHIHNPIKSITVPLSTKNTSILLNKEPSEETKISLPDDIVKEDQETSENDLVSGTVKRTTRRKSSPVKRQIMGGIKSNSTPVPLNSTPKKPSIDHSPRRNLKRRSVSAAVVNSTTIISLKNKSSRGNRTTSASCIPTRSLKRRSHSATSVTLPLSNRNSNQRKKQKISNYWILVGKGEQKLVSIHTDKPPVFRKCYTSIRHITEKDVIKSNDCVILRPETDTRNDATPYLAKVKWFWEEPSSGEIHMSLMWYYHPEHAELSLRVKERFLPNEVLASKYSDCINVACIEDKCYVLNLNEYNRYCLREKSTNLFEHSEPIGQLKSLLNKNTSTVHHRPLPAKTVGNQNIFFCRYVYDYRAKRILKNPSLTSTTLPTTSHE